MQKKGTPVKYHVAAADEEYWYLLKQKLQEEVSELNGRNGDAEALIDILDVIDAMITFKNFDRKEIEAVRENKAIEQGKFANRIVLDQSDEEIGRVQSQGV